MRIIQPCGPSHRDDGACFYLMRQLNLIPGVTYERKTMLEPEAGWGDYDGVLYVDWGQDNFPHLPPFTPNAEKPSLCWQSDTHWRKASGDYRYAQAALYRVAAFCQKNAADLFAHGPPAAKTVWVPHAGDHTMYTPCLKSGTVLSYVQASPEAFLDPGAWEGIMCERVPHWDLCFVGHVGDPRRDEVLERMFSAIPNFTFNPGLFFQEAVKVYHDSAIVFNVSVRGELNMRTFEALCSRSFLLTDRQIGMDLLGLEDGVHCAIYDTVEEAQEKARYYLAHDDLRRKIADAGWRWALANHTYWHRARSLLRHMGFVV